MIKINLVAERKPTKAKGPGLLSGLTLGTNISGFSYAAVGTNWYSLRFTDDEGVRLPYEVQSWDTGGTSRLWVRVAELTNNAVLSAWWGNAAVTSLASLER